MFLDHQHLFFFNTPPQIITSNSCTQFQKAQCLPQRKQQLRNERILANCKAIWGAQYDYDFDLETDDYVLYWCTVKRDYGLSIGPALTITAACHGEEGAWNELDRMLGIWARVTERGTPMTREERLAIFSGPRGEYRNLLEKVMDEKDRIEEASKKNGSQGEARMAAQ